MSFYSFLCRNKKSLGKCTYFLHLVHSYTKLGIDKKRIIVYNKNILENKGDDKMNIYEMSIQKFNEFKGEKLTVWESGKSKVWMEVNQNFDVCVYVSRNGKTRNGRWMIGYMMYQNGVMSYKLNSEYKLKTDYKAWTERAQKE